MSATPRAAQEHPTMSADGFSPRSLRDGVDRESSAAVPRELAEPALSVESGETAVCSKCRETCSVEDLESTSRDRYMLGKKTNLVEKVCSLNYKCLARRWKDNKRLKTWWSAKDEDAKVEWYKEHKALKKSSGSSSGGAGNSRLDFTFAEHEVESRGVDKRRRRIWKSQSMWERDRCIEEALFANKTKQEREQAWNQALLNQDVVKMKIDGAWHIGEYLGVIEDEVHSKRMEARKGQKRKVSSMEEAAAAKLCSDEVMKQATTHFSDEWNLDVLRPAASVVLDSLVLGQVTPQMMPARSLIVESLQEFIDEQAEIRENMESVLARELMEAEQAVATSGTECSEKLDGARLASWVSKVAKGKAKFLAMFDFDVNTMTELQEYCKELVDTPADFQKVAEDAIKPLVATRQEIERVWDEFTAALEADDSLEPAFADARLKEVRSSCAALHRPLKKSMSLLRGLLSKHQRDLEKQSSQMISNSLATVEGSAVHMKSPAMNFLFTNVHGGQNSGVSTSLAEWSQQAKPVILRLEAFAADIAKHEAFKSYTKWFDDRASEKKGDKLVAAADVALSKAVLSGVCSGLEGGAVLTEKKLFVKKEQRLWSQSLFEVQHYIFDAGATQTSALPMGLPEARVSISGRMMILGVKMDGDTAYGDQLKRLKAASGSALAEMLKAQPGNFLMLLEAGHLCAIPSGYIVIHYAADACRGFRWGMFTKHEGEHRRVMQTVASVIDSFPAMNSGPYQAWLAHLMGDQRSHEKPAAPASDAQVAGAGGE